MKYKAVSDRDVRSKPSCKMPNNFHTTFGSQADDDGYYLELRDNANNPFSFLTFWIEDDRSLKVAIGEGQNAVIMPLDELNAVIAEASERLKQAKQDWDSHREKYDL